MTKVARATSELEHVLKSVHEAQSMDILQIEKRYISVSVHKILAKNEPQIKRTKGNIAKFYATKIGSFCSYYGIQFLEEQRIIHGMELAFPIEPPKHLPKEECVNSENETYIHLVIRKFYKRFRDLGFVLTVTTTTQIVEE